MSKKILISTLAMVAALAPAGEEFTAEAVNEGIWLTEAHLNAIEAKLAADATAATTATNDIAAANTARQTAEGALATANSTIEANKTRIAALEAENAKLKKDPAAPITQTSTETDPPPPGAGAKKNKYETSVDRQLAAYRES